MIRLQESGVAMSLASSSLLTDWMGLLAVAPRLPPGWAARTVFLWPKASKVCFLQAGICRKDWFSPSLLCLQHMCFAVANWKCMTPRYSLKGTFSPEVRLDLLSYPARALALRSFFWTHCLRAYEVYSSLLLFPSPFFFFFLLIEPEANGTFCSGGKTRVISYTIFSSLTLKCVREKPNGLKLIINSLLSMVGGSCQVNKYLLSCIWSYKFMKTL